MNNPMSLMADASKLSIPQLQQAIKNGTVPPYIGVPLLQQKVKESQQAKQSMAMQQPMQPPVAQSVMQQAQGVSGLPTNLPEQSMAGGGIISFAEGGTYGSADYDPAMMEQDYRNDARAQYRNYKTNRPEYGIGAIGAHIAYRNDYASLQRNAKSPYDDAINYYKSISDFNGLIGAQSKRNEWLQNPTNLSEYGRSQTAAKPALTLPAQTLPTQVLPARPTATTPATPAQSLPAGRSEQQQQTRRETPSAGAGISGLGYTPAKYDTGYIDKLIQGENNPATGKPYTKAEIYAERKQDFIDAGGDPDVYKTQKEAAEKAGAKTDSEKRLEEASPWFAVSKAFGEAQPNAGILGTIGKAMGAYGAERGANIKADKLQAESTRKELGQIALAQNAYSVAQAAGDHAAMQKAKDDLDKLTMLSGSTDMKSVDATNEALKSGAQNATSIKAANIGASASMYAADKADRARDGVINQIMADNPSLNRTQATEQFYKITNPYFNNVGLRDADSRRDALNAELKSLPMSTTLTAPEKKLREAQIRAALIALNNTGGENTAPANTVESHLKNGFKIN